MNQLPPIFDFTARPATQTTDIGLQKLRLSPTSSLKLKDIPIQGTDVSLVCDTSTDVPRPYVPPKFRYPVFEKLHSLLHPGVRAIQQLLKSHYVWTSINADVRNRTRCCLSCQCSKIHKHTVTPLSTISTPDVRCDHIHIDLVGPLPPSNGYSYIHTNIDHFTRWVEVIPIVDIIV